MRFFDSLRQLSAHRHSFQNSINTFDYIHLDALQNYSTSSLTLSINISFYLFQFSLISYYSKTYLIQYGYSQGNAC